MGDSDAVSTKIGKEDDILKGPEHFACRDELDKAIMESPESCRAGLCRPFDEFRKEIVEELGLD